MRALLSVALVGAALASAGPSILNFRDQDGTVCSLQKTGGNIEGSCDVRAPNGASIEGNRNELRQYISQTNARLDQINATLVAGLDKLDALHDFVHHTSDGLSQAHSIISANAQQIASNDADIATNLQRVSANAVADASRASADDSRHAQLSSNIAAKPTKATQKS